MEIVWHLSATGVMIVSQEDAFSSAMEVVAATRTTFKRRKSVSNSVTNEVNISYEVNVSLFVNNTLLKYF